MARARGNDVFISYHWRDRQRVEAIAQWLSSEGKLSVFLDRWYLVPGQPWPQALEKAVSSSSAVAVCIGAGELGPWQQREMNLALERQVREPRFPVIPVLLPGADPVLGFLTQNTWVDLREAADDPLLLSTLVSAVRGEPPGRELREQVSTRASVCPYRGLLPFREEDAPFFFGREIAIQQLVAAVARNGLTAVVGASGCGKSSVVRAGLVPRLRETADAVWEIATVLPGDRPLRALAAAYVPLLQPDVAEVDLLLEVDKLARGFAAGQAALRDVVERVLVKQSGTQRVLLVVDQWEELYTLTDDTSARQRFIDMLLDASAHASLSVVLTLRGDFVGDALAYRPLADRMQDAQVNVGPMTRHELTRAIEAPSTGVGLQFESGLVQRILEDVGDEPGHLPLLEFVLKRLWEMKQGHVLQHDAYDHIGKLEGAVASKAESVFAALSELEQGTVRKVFLQLARPGEGRDYTRRRATSAELPDFSSAVIKRLADERLVVVTGQSAGTTETTIEVAHEALIRHWQRLREWLDRDHEFLLWRQRLRPLIGEWQRAHEVETALLHGSFLSEAERWRNERPDELTTDERRYIGQAAELRVRQETERRERQEQELAHARALAEAERQRTEERENRIADQRRANRKLTRVLGLLSVMVVALLIAGGWALYQTRESRAAADTARRALAASDFREALTRAHEGDVRGALAFFAAALRLDPDNAAIRAASIRALVEVHPPSFLLPHAKEVSWATFSPDGTRIATASADNTARVWGASTGQPVGTPLQHEGEVVSAAFSPDGTRVVTASRDKTVRLWDARTGQAVGRPLQHGDHVNWASFSPDGTRLVSASDDKTARVWNVSTGQSVADLQHSNRVNSATFSPDGTRVVTASDDKTARVWDARTGRPVGNPLQHADTVRVAAFNSDGTCAVTASSDKTARVWNIRTGQPVGLPLKHEEDVISAAFSPDDTRVVTASLDGTARLWDARTGTPVGEPFQHGGPVLQAAFSPDGMRVVTASWDKTVRLWDARGDQPAGRLLQHGDSVLSAAFSPDGMRLVTTSLDKMARVWDVRIGPPVGVPLQHEGDVLSAAFSPDGTRVVTTSLDLRLPLRLWDARTGQLLVGVREQAWGAHSADFSPDGTLLVTAGHDNTAQVWDARTGQPGPAPLQHADSVSSAAFSTDGTRVVTASRDKTARVWDARTGQPVGGPFQHAERVHLAAFSPDGTQVITASSDKAARVWDARTGQPVGVPLKHGDEIKATAFSPDGTRVITASNDQTARIWDARTGQPVGATLQHTSQVNSAAFSPDGTRVVTASSDNTARVWDAHTMQPVGAPLQHATLVSSAVFSPDGARVVTASLDETARVWDAHTGQPVGGPFQHARWVTLAAFSLDGTRVVTASWDKTARLWDVPAGTRLDATLLAEAAEAISGQAVNEAHSVVRLDDAPVRLASLKKKVAEASSGRPTAVSILRWVFEDPWTRPISPLTVTTVENYIIERLKQCTPDARREVESHFLGHPLFQRAAEFCAAVSTHILHFQRELSSLAADRLRSTDDRNVLE